MPCLLGCLAVVSPRLALFLVWLFGGGYVVRPYGSWVWPALGFVFFPLTTLAFAFAFNSLGHHGQVTPFGWLLTGIALLCDIGLIGGGHSQWRQRRDSDRDSGG
jgi:hypothetical protein